MGGPGCSTRFVKKMNDKLSPRDLGNVAESLQIVGFLQRRCIATQGIKKPVRDCILKWFWVTFGSLLASKGVQRRFFSEAKFCSIKSHASQKKVMLASPCKSLKLHPKPSAPGPKTWSRTWCSSGSWSCSWSWGC